MNVVVSGPSILVDVAVEEAIPTVPDVVSTQVRPQHSVEVFSGHCAALDNGSQPEVK